MNRDEKFDFSFPEGYEKAKALLDYLPEEEKDGMMFFFLAMVLYE